jgi:hypothetical protein
LGGAALLVYYFWAMKVRRAMADTPTSKVRSAAMGLVEFKGLAAPWGPVLAAPFSAAECVWHRWRVEEERLDFDRGRRRRRWVEVGSGESFLPFALDDQTGLVKIEPEGAHIEATRLLNYTSGGLWKSASAPRTAAAQAYLASPNRVRIQEWRIEAGLPLYTLGTLKSVRTDSGRETVLASPPSGASTPFVISSKLEEQLSRGLMWRSLGSALVGAGLILFCGGWLAQHFGFSRYGDNLFDFFKKAQVQQAAEPKINGDKAPAGESSPLERYKAPADGSY